MEKETQNKIFDELMKRGNFDEKEMFLRDIRKISFSDIGERVLRTYNSYKVSKEEFMPPDTYGVERIFLEFFLTEQMVREFDLIARDFLEHEYQNLDQYHELEYLNESYEYLAPAEAFRHMILNLMFNAYKKGSAFAKAQFQFLYKKYYKKEYNQLKRFRQIDVDYLRQFLDNSSSEMMAWIDISRVLTIGRILDIEIPADCSIIIMYINEWAEDFLINDYEEPDSINQEMIERAEIILRERFGNEEKLYESLSDAESLLIAFSDYFAMPTGFVYDCEDRYFTLFDIYSRALAIYMEMGNDTEGITDKEIHYIAFLYRTVSVIADNSSEACEQMNLVMRNPDWIFNIRQNSLYDAAQVMKLSEQAAVAPHRDVPVSEKTEPSPHVEAELQKEIDRLREQVHSLENNEKSYRGEISKKDKQLSEMEILLTKQREEHDELVALRDYVYSMTEQDNESPGLSLQEMSAAIAPRRIVIIGGHSNWVNKMRNEFPGWSFISREVSGVVDKDIVKNADKVYFFTDSLAHSVYYRYMNLVREGKVPFGYIHGVNIQMNVEQIYRELEGTMVSGSVLH